MEFSTDSYSNKHNVPRIIKENNPDLFHRITRKNSHNFSFQKHPISYNLLKSVSLIFKVGLKVEKNNEKKHEHYGLFNKYSFTASSQRHCTGNEVAIEGKLK